MGPFSFIAIDDYLLFLLAACARCLLVRQNTLDCNAVMGQLRSPCGFITRTGNLVRGDATVTGHVH